MDGAKHDQESLCSERKDLSRDDTNRLGELAASGMKETWNYSLASALFLSWASSTPQPTISTSLLRWLSPTCSISAPFMAERHSRHRCLTLCGISCETWDVTQCSISAVIARQPPAPALRPELGQKRPAQARLEPCRHTDTIGPDPLDQEKTEGEVGDTEGQIHAHGGPSVFAG